MKRDVEIIELPNGNELVIAVDNSGSIGMKSKDDIQVPYDVVSYYNFRVAWMECVSAGATPISIILHNFSGDNAWPSLIQGVERGVKEVKQENIKITGSTESNFVLEQSAVGLVVIGEREQAPVSQEVFLDEPDSFKVSVIGNPLVGDELLQNEDAIAPLEVFQDLADLKRVLLLPVGSKGILYELNQIFNGQPLDVDSCLDLEKSSGPATCFIIVYVKRLEHKIKSKCGKWLHDINLKFR